MSGGPVTGDEWWLEQEPWPPGFVLPRPSNRDEWYLAQQRHGDGPPSGQALRLTIEIRSDLDPATLASELSVLVERHPRVRGIGQVWTSHEVAHG